MQTARCALYATMLLVCSCAYTPTIPNVQERTMGYVGKVTQHPETLSVLSVTGGLCLAAGMVLLVVTGGKKGWYPVIGGILLVVLNYVVARYSDFLFYPLVVFTGMISAAWTYKTVRQILLEKKPK
jgi:hypothetical protein|tara:strand:+ start:1112 stop:1489 length:378 start_codon:yes stop_codon:yes gene_type:complete